MTVENIIKRVRWCVDKERQNQSSLSGVTQDDTFIDNMIKAHVGDALYWCSYYGSSKVLNGSSTATYGILKSYAIDTSGGDGKLKVEAKESQLYGEITLPEEFVKLVRVRMGFWYKAVSDKTLVAEDSDEYLELRDETAAATSALPKACIINTVPKKLEVYPYSTSGQITIAVTPDLDTEDITSETDIDIPKTVETGFIYYLAFLLLSALSDSNANTMLEIAKMNVGLQESNK